MACTPKPIRRQQKRILWDLLKAGRLKSIHRFRDLSTGEVQVFLSFTNEPD